MAETKAVTSPSAIFTGGQPGAGKTAIRRMAEVQLDFNAVIIDPDDLRRFHPDYDYLMETDNRNAATLVNEDASAWAAELFQEAVKTSRNIIIDGSLGNFRGVEKKCIRLREAGYHTEAHVMAVSDLKSRFGIIFRYEKSIADGEFARWVPPDIHDRAYHGLIETVKTLEAGKTVDRLVIHSRETLFLYDNQLQNGNWQQKPQALLPLLTERIRDWTPDERKRFEQDMATTSGWLERRGAPSEETQELAAVNRDYRTRQSGQDHLWFVARGRHSHGVKLPCYNNPQDAVKIKIHDAESASIYKVARDAAVFDAAGVIFDANAIKAEYSGTATEQEINHPPDASREHDQHNEMDNADNTGNTDNEMDNEADDEMEM